MLRETVGVGQKFHWQEEGGNGRAGIGIVTAIKTDRQEGLSPEMEDYAALWFESKGLEGSMAGEAFTVLLATDELTYLYGHRVTITLV